MSIIHPSHSSIRQFETEYEVLELSKLEEAVAQLQIKLEGAQRERRHAQMEKVGSFGFPHV